MAATKKRGGRVTPKGTRDGVKKKAKVKPGPPAKGKGPDQVLRRNLVEKGRGARPITHHRGNR